MLFNVIENQLLLSKVEVKDVCDQNSYYFFLMKIVNNCMTETSFI